MSDNAKIINARKKRREQLKHQRRIRQKIQITVLCTVLLLSMLFVYHSCQPDEPTPGETLMDQVPDGSPAPDSAGSANDGTSSISPEDTTESSPETSETTTDEPDRSLLDFLKIAVQPVGSTMYVWGGGWNEADDGAGIEAVTLGVSSWWAEFAQMQNSSYDYRDTEYQIHDGLDCSGYVGWAVYNILETENGQDGYVLGATKMAREYADRGFGEYIPTAELTCWLPGDIMSMDGHVWIVVGMCDDGSVLFLHASPPGVIFCGTNLADGSKSQAVKLAEEIMSTHYPDWYAKFPKCSRSYSYLTQSWAMRWSRDILSDEDGVTDMSADEIVALIYG